MNVVMNEYPEVVFSVLYMLICLVLIVIFALTESMKERASLLKNGDVKENLEEQEIVNDSKRDNSGNEGMVPHSDTSIGLNMAKSANK